MPPPEPRSRTPSPARSSATAVGFPQPRLASTAARAGPRGQTRRSGAGPTPGRPGRSSRTGYSSPPRRPLVSHVPARRAPRRRTGSTSSVMASGSGLVVGVASVVVMGSDSVGGWRGGWVRRGSSPWTSNRWRWAPRRDRPRSRRCAGAGHRHATACSRKGRCGGGAVVGRRESIRARPRDHPGDSVVVDHPVCLRWLRWCID